jgi:autotransporter-associated beta strand protein
VYQFNFGTGTVMVSGSALTTTANATLTGATAATGGTINTNGLGANWNGVLSGSGWLVKAGAGTLNLGGANTYTGGTAFNGGTVFADALSDLGALSAGMSFNGGTLQLGVADLLTTRTGAMALAGAGTIDTNGFNTGYAGAISGTGSLTKAGAGTLTLSGTNTYSGATTISTGTLATSGSTAIGDASAVTVASGATLSLGGSETVGSLAGAGSVALAANTLTAGGNNGSTSFTGTTAGTGGFTKAGTGTLSTGNLAHTGLTTVNGGNLNVNGSVAGSVTVNSGGTLSGNTAIAGNLTLNAGGTLSSGNSPGTTTVAGNYIGGGLLNVEVQFNNAGAPVNGTTHDFLNITGNVSGVSTLNILAVAPSTAPTVTSGNGIELVRVGGTTGAGAFVLGGPVVQGGIQYLLNYLPNYSGTLDGYFLQATARDELAGHVAMLSAGRAMLTRCSRGDERFGGAVGASGKRAWAKFMGGSIETGADTGLDTDQEFSCSAGGMDLASGANLRIGLAGAFGDTSVDVTTAAGVSKLEGEQNMIEAQASYDMDGTFVNMTAGYAGTDWTHTGPASGIKTASVDGLVASLQVGRRWSLGEAWQVGVSGGLDYDGTTCADACLLAGVASQESNWRGSLAAKLSGTGAVFRPFAAISYADDLDGGNSVSLGGVSVAADTASSLLGARAGFDARLGERFGLFVDAGMVEGLDNDVTGYDGQAGLRINW